MTNWKVAPSYKYAKILSVNEATHKAYIEEKCDRCGGGGLIASRVENGHIIPIPVDGGICYKCNGEGKIYKWVKAYTEEEMNKYLASRERAKEKRVAKEKARLQELADNSEMNKKELLTKWGYDAEAPFIYIVAGEDTYSIKDTLKAAGARFNPTLGWYFQHEIQVPEGYTLAAVDFNKVFDWFPLVKRFEIKENAKEVVAAALNKVMPKSSSEFVGEIKDRLRDLKVTLKDIRSFDGFYGNTNIYTFNYEGNILVWMTSSYKNIEKGCEYTLTGTIKKHTEYKGVKQTELSRCIIK